MKYRNIITAIFISLCALPSAVAAQEPSALSPKQRAITEIASLTAKTDLGTLSNVLDSALDSVLTVNEAKEVIQSVKLIKPARHIHINFASEKRLKH